MKEDKNIYQLDLHESIHIDNGGTKITRVPGGWTYTIYRLDSGQMNTVFVPFYSDFQ